MNMADEFEQNDSGMESLTTSKDDTPERIRPEVYFITPSVGSSPSGEPPLGPLKEYDDVSMNYALRQYDANVKNTKDHDDEPDETLSERLWGLTEMFPECVRNGTHKVSTKTWFGVKSLYGLSCSVMWVVASSSVILFAPVIFEVERAQMAEMEKSQQKQVLLGTNTALSGPMPNMPPMPR